MTIFFIAITVIVSLLAFNQPELFTKLQMNPYQVYHRKEYYRLITHGFVHVDWTHLIINMFVLYSFGPGVESIFRNLQDMGYIHYYTFWYSGFYVSSIIMASSLDIFKHKDHPYYNSVGASGAVSAIIFFFIFFYPYHKLGLFMIIPVPGILFAIAYLIYSQYMSKKGGDHVNHDAHFLGAVYGFIFPLIIKVSLIYYFINSITRFDLF